MSGDYYKSLAKKYRANALRTPRGVSSGKPAAKMGTRKATWSEPALGKGGKKKSVRPTANYSGIRIKWH